MCYEEVAGFQEPTHQAQRYQGHLLDKGDDFVEFGRGVSPLRSLSFMSEIIVVPSLHLRPHVFTFSPLGQKEVMGTLNARGWVDMFVAPPSFSRYSRSYY